MGGRFIIDDLENRKIYWLFKLGLREQALIEYGQSGIEIRTDSYHSISSFQRLGSVVFLKIKTIWDGEL